MSLMWPSSKTVRPGFSSGPEPQAAAHVPGEVAAFVIFFGTTIDLIFQKYVRLDTWVICLVVQCLMVVCGVLSQEGGGSPYAHLDVSVVRGLPGHGQCYQHRRGSAHRRRSRLLPAKTLDNPFLIYLMFFIIPFLMTQVMQNRGVMLIFIPLAAQACKSMGANPDRHCDLCSGGLPHRLHDSYGDRCGALLLLAAGRLRPIKSVFHSPSSPAILFLLL